MTMDDYDEVLALWKESEGVGLSRSDSRRAVRSYLERNPGMSFVARCGGRVVGAVLCGHDGRRGCVHHLAVGKEFRRRGIGSLLVERCLARLRRERIDKCNLFLFEANREGRKFWSRTGWRDRADLRVMQRELSAGAGRRRSC
ncbi:MAG: GNAT family N-acetyltransferase [Verrucomicrobiota bacterium]